MPITNNTRKGRVVVKKLKSKSGWGGSRRRIIREGKGTIGFFGRLGEGRRRREKDERGVKTSCFIFKSKMLCIKGKMRGMFVNKTPYYFTNCCVIRSNHKKKGGVIIGILRRRRKGRLVPKTFDKTWVGRRGNVVGNEEGERLGGEVFSRGVEGDDHVASLK